ncbi:hypothetical protein CLUG_03229 [Clavispora lusitaniae ATCC 42720]|uniref:Peptidase A1 domain-containing protein n=1 Tax=Clavispora lusitaniae (strain ATCC 42720) TaxID=306902 RepID=C4Y4Z5_CLAL4|nr:uncharacterized protein CLUG_03229 [Clavispora lusitaniae ATCC 42720]EEQ39101.1 hypothetical protein CLUG_03229 [Clavispora lusitaniae ATCC 42720]KAF5210042.1 hypothetical protein E0198_002901 [Clavispora lusitaniae]
MRTGILLSIAAVAAQSAYRPLNKTTDVFNQTQGVSLGSPPLSVVTQFSFEDADLMIPYFMNTTDGDFVFRPDMPPNASWVYEGVYTSYTDDPLFGEDRVFMNGFELQNFTFQTLDEYAPPLVKVGLGLTHQPNFIDISLIQSLKDSGYIKSRSFSLFHNTSASEYEADQVLFGALDHGKYDGPMTKVKGYSNTTDGFVNTVPSILVDGIAGYNFSLTSQSIAIISDNKWSFPLDYYESLSDYFMARYNYDTNDAVPCSILNSTEYISFYFSGAEYRILEGRFFRNVEENNTTFCAFAVGSEVDNSFRLHRELFKNHYLVVDYDNEEIGIAQAATKPKPQTIEEMSTGIPSATPAKYFSDSNLRYSTVSRNHTDLYITQTAHPTYAMYTGERLGLSATESFYFTSTSSSESQDTKTAKPKESTEVGNNGSSDKSSSSKGDGNVQKTSGIFAFIACGLGMMMF